MIFRNRKEAGSILAGKLIKYVKANTVILAIPRGGVPVAYEIAQSYGIPLELILIKKIGHPANKEYAIGAASLSHYFIKDHESIDPEYIMEELERIRHKMKALYSKFKGNQQPVQLKDKIVIIVDDGIATGNTMIATIQVVKESKPEKIIVATPVASSTAVKGLKEIADDVIAVYIPPEFYGVGAFYQDFEQVADEEVVDLINKSTLSYQGDQ
jgi:predicted phosphoribosyltransferase